MKRHWTGLLCGTGIALIVFMSAADAASLFGRRKEGGAKAGASVNREDINAKRLLHEAKRQIEMNQRKEAIATLTAVGDRFPNSVVRFDAWLLLGDVLHGMRQYDKAVAQFERVSRAMQDGMEIQEDLIVQSLLKAGISFFEAGKYNQCIAKMRRVVGDYGNRAEANDAYYYIGLCHFKRKNWINAIRSLELVGTNIDEETSDVEYLEARKRLFIKVEDPDLAVLKKKGDMLVVEVSTRGHKQQDFEKVALKPLTMKGDVYIGNLGTVLGEPFPNDGALQLYGLDQIDVKYIDGNTADQKRNLPRLRSIKVVGNGVCGFVDGAYKDLVSKVVLGETAFLRVIDYDADRSAGKDAVEIRVRSLLPVETDEVEEGEREEEGEEGVASRRKIRYELRDEVAMQLQEREVPKPEYSETAKKSLARGHLKSEKDWSVPAKQKKALEWAESYINAQLIQHKRNVYHSGVFGGEIRVEELAEGTMVDKADKRLVAAPGDVLEIEYIDQYHTEGEQERVLTTRAGTLQPKESPLEVIRNQVRERDLRVRKLLQQAKALLNLGRLFQELGLNDRAKERFMGGLEALDQIAAERGYPQTMKEEMLYVRSQLFLAMDDMNRAADVLLGLLRDFPDSEFGEGALLQLAELSMQKEEYSSAVRFFQTVIKIPASLRKAEAQYRIGEAYEMWGAAEAKQKKLEAAMSPYQGAGALKAYQTCISKYPDSVWAGKAVGKVASFYYARGKYQQAIELFDRILEDYQDSSDVVPGVLLNYGKCLYQTKDYAKAIEKWQQILVNYPTAKEARIAKRFIPAAQKKMN